MVPTARPRDQKNVRFRNDMSTEHLKHRYGGATRRPRRGPDDARLEALQLSRYATNSQSSNSRTGHRNRGDVENPLDTSGGLKTDNLELDR